MTALFSDNEGIQKRQRRGPSFCDFTPLLQDVTQTIHKSTVLRITLPAEPTAVLLQIPHFSLCVPCTLTQMPIPLPYYHVDAFTAQPFSGNPAAVILLDPGVALEDCTLQQLAAEFNLSETAFVRPLEEGRDFSTGSKFSLRWMTPTTEVKLCGHATLATAHALFAKAGNVQETVEFETLSGTLSVTKGAHGVLSMKFPVNLPESADLHGGDRTAVLQQLIAVLLGASGAAAVQEACYNAATKKLIVRLKDNAAELLAAVESRPAELLAVDQTALGAHNITGISVTVKAPAAAGAAKAHAGGAATADVTGEHFWSRYFAPWNGIPEDPVNGSSHTLLAPFWAERLGLWKEEQEGGAVLRKAELVARMCSKRGGVLHLQAVLRRQKDGDASAAPAEATAAAAELSWAGVDAAASFVLIGGAATVVAEGVLTL